MPLVFSAVVPHPPLLIPNIGKDEIKKVKKTQEAMEKLEQDLYLSKPDLIMIISPHGSLFADAFSINAHTHFFSNFAQFGDLQTKSEWHGEPALAAVVRNKSYEMKIPVQVVSEEALDHGATVPLFYLTPHLPHAKLMPIGYCNLNSKMHLDFGYLLKEIAMNTEKRVALIASGDLSHGLTTDAPAGFSKVGKKFDKEVIKMLENHNTVGYSQLDSEFVAEAAECGYRSILILLGVLQRINYTFKNYSYEGPFGVGYLVGNFII